MLHGIRVSVYGRALPYIHGGLLPGLPRGGVGVGVGSPCMLIKVLPAARYLGGIIKYFVLHVRGIISFYFFRFVVIFLHFFSRFFSLFS